MPRPARSVLTTLAMVGLALTAAACGSTPVGPAASASPSGPASATPTPAASPSSPAVPATPDTGASVPADLRERPAVAAALDDAARRQAATADQVDVAAFTPVTWNDGALGCPEKDMSYTQATVEGELLILRVGTALLQYHGRVGGPYAYCAAPTGGYAVG